MTDPYLSWKEPRIADCMYELTMGELQNESHPPFKYFLMAMKLIHNYLPSPAPYQWAMIDAGCGVGHYGHLTQKHYLDIDYNGFDFSPAMVELANRVYPELNIFTADAKIFDYTQYAIVLASSLIEVMDEWFGGAEAICKTAPGIVLLHRVRVWGNPTERQEPEGYPNQSTYAWVHNEAELLQFFLQRHFPTIWTRHWDEFADSPFNMATYIFKRM